MRHGYAVAIGMVYASRLAHKTGLCDASVPERVEKLIRSYGLPADLSALSRKPSVTELMDTMQIDKKAEGGKVKFVLPKKIGEVVITKEWEEQQLELWDDQPAVAGQLQGGSMSEYLWHCPFCNTDQTVTEEGPADILRRPYH